MNLCSLLTTPKEITTEVFFLFFYNKAFETYTHFFSELGCANLGFLDQAKKALLETSQAFKRNLRRNSWKNPKVPGGMSEFSKGGISKKTLVEMIKERSEFQKELLEEYR